MSSNSDVQKAPVGDVEGPEYPKGPGPGPGPTTGQFTPLRNQKLAARERDEHPDEETEEYIGFMGHKPGYPETLPGWDKLKDLSGYTT